MQNIVSILNIAILLVYQIIVHFRTNTLVFLKGLHKRVLLVHCTFLQKPMRAKLNMASFRSSGLSRIYKRRRGERTSGMPVTHIVAQMMTAAMVG
jgi:hypothetical protein